jgi:hypothetical protein
MATRRRSRREALAAAAAAAAAVALGPAAAAASALDRAKGSDEPGALHALVVAELNATFAYRNAGLAPLGPRLAVQEDDHARALTSHLQALGMPLPPVPSRAAQLPPPPAALLEASGDAARRRAAIALEESLIGGCATELEKLGDPNMIRTVATVMASHSQHLAVLRRAAALDPLSSER